MAPTDKQTDKHTHTQKIRLRKHVMWQTLFFKIIIWRRKKWRKKTNNHCLVTRKFVKKNFDQKNWQQISAIHFVRQFNGSNIETNFFFLQWTEILWKIMMGQKKLIKQI